MGGTRPKQLLFLESLPILAHTINNFAAALPGAQIVVVLPAAHMDYWRNLAARFEVAAHTLAEGGEERFHSVRSGLAALAEGVELIAVQDGVRPLASHEMIRRTAEAAAQHGAAIPVIEPVDSFRRVDIDIDGNGNRAASQIIDRRTLRIVQTPQIFSAETLRRAYEAAYQSEFTDDASVVEQSGAPIFLCEGERTNLKITSPEDLEFAQAILTARLQQKPADEEHL